MYKVPWLSSRHIDYTDKIVRPLQYESIRAQLEIAGSPNTKIIVMGKGNAPVILDAKGQ